MLKTCFKREGSKIFIYQDYKNFNETDFCMDVENKLEEYPKHYKNSEKTFVKFLDAHAPRKTKVYVVIKNHMLIRIFVKLL